MANKVVNHTYTGMTQDVTQSKFSNQFYFDAKNIRIISTNSQSTNSITNEKGNKFILTIPKPVINTTNLLDKKIIYGNKTLSFKTEELNSSQISGEQLIIGQCTTKTNIILFTTDNNGFDCIWKVNFNDYDLKLVYLRNMEFSINYPIQCINNYENLTIDKIYWIDGKSQIKFLNLEYSIANKDLEELIDINLNSIESTSSFNFSQPIISDVVKGGFHTAGMIQYAYNLYKINSSESKLSPITNLISLDKFDLGGGKVNEIVSSTPIININDIDVNFTHIKVYAIKYTSFNETPSISVIKDQLIPSSKNLEIFDDGFVIKTISLENFLFLGSDILNPKHIESKQNRLFSANYKEINFEVDLDCKAYSFNNSGIAKLYKNIFLLPDNETVSGEDFNVNGLNYDNFQLIKHDSINLNYDLNKFQSNGTTKGGEGKYLKYELTQEINKTKYSKFFKDSEIYRCGIVFYNSYGQSSFPNWIADFKSLDGNLNNLYNTFKLTLKPEFYVWLNTTVFQNKYDKPVGYKVVIAQRNLVDKTIVANGIISPMMINNETSDENGVNDINNIRNLGNTLPKIPNILLRNSGTSLYGVTKPLRTNGNLEVMNNSNNSWISELQSPDNSNDFYKRGYQFNSMMQLYSPEILFDFNQNLSSDLKLKIKGVVKNNENACWYKNLRYQPDNVISDQGKCFGGISPSASASVLNLGGDPYNPMAWGLISYPAGSQAEEDRAVTHMNFYRNYSNKQSLNVTKNNILLLQNDLTDLTANDSALIRIKSINNLRGVQFNLNQTYNKSKITYTFTPNTGYLTVPYTVKVYSDDSGTNVINSLINVIGNQSIIINETLNLTPLTLIKNYFFSIETSTAILIKTDIDCKLGNTSNLSFFNKNSLNNNYNILNNVLVSSTNVFTKSNQNIEYSIYGLPELTERGQDYKSYNNDSKYRYTNSLQSVGTDGNTNFQNNGDFGRRIASINSYNNRCITMVLSNNNVIQDHWLRPTIEQLYNETLTNIDGVALIGELVISNKSLYLGNIYGGNSFESKKRTNYLEVGNYKSITENENYVISPGDTFVGNFKFQRISRLDTSIVAEQVSQYNEIVEVICETSVDLKNRNDLSLTAWDSTFQPINNSYEKYNKVYSQNNILITKRDVNFNFKKINNFETNVIASKLKSPGEIIDSWTDFLVNEVITLDGKYGPINSLINFNDELYTIQDRSFGRLSISPRIQVQGSDGIGIQLGTGQILDKYIYISNVYGTLNKWSVVVSPNAVYFYDILNKSFNIYKGEIGKLSDLKGMHHYFLNNTNTDILKLDNPLLKTGISSSFDYINNDVFMTLHQNEKSFNISYNEQTNNFISFYDYIPSLYISRGDHFITTSPNLKEIYKQYEGNYNEYYGIKYKSSFTLNVNPEATVDCTFDNIGFKSDVTLNGVDQVDKTLTNITAYNDYQNVNKISVPLIVGRNNNLRRKFRNWNALIPREGRNRIKAPYIKLKLDFNNTLNYKLILHDLQIYYTTY